MDHTARGCAWSGRTDEAQRKNRKAVVSDPGIEKRPRLKGEKGTSEPELLSRLRKRSPGKSDREALERAARIQLGFETIQRAQERSAAAGVDEDEVMAETVRGVRESRRSRAAWRAA
jgi:hypothetical protein